MKRLQNLILFTVMTVTGAILPITTASAIGEITYYVPIVACRIFDTRHLGKTPANTKGTSVPFVATKIRAGTTMFDTNHYFINGGDLFIAAQGGSASYEDKNVCDIPSEAVAIHINLSAIAPRGGKSWLRVWPYDGTLPDNENGAQATVMSWDGSQLGNAMPLSVTPPGTGFHFTVRVFFQTAEHPEPSDNSTHISGDILGYYLPAGI